MSCKPRSSREEFIATAIAMHGDVYDYSQVVYRSRRSRVVIICQQHGEFDQEAASHIRGDGCPRCNRPRASLPGVQRQLAEEQAAPRFATLPRPIHPIDALLRAARERGAAC